MISFARILVRLWIRDPDFRSLVILVFLTLLIGTVFYSLQEGWGVIDAFYFSVTTLTTVGLGDHAPTTPIGKLFAVAYIFQRTRPHRGLHKCDSGGEFKQADEEAQERGRSRRYWGRLATPRLPLPTLFAVLPRIPLLGNRVDRGHRPT